MRYADARPTNSPFGSYHQSGVDHILVVFVGHTDCHYLRCLKKGFRHCFVAFKNKENWIICDLLKNHIEFSVVNLPADFDLSAFYKEKGHTVVSGCFLAHEREPSYLLEFLTCVTMTKRIIGLRSLWTFTPWQLFRRLVSIDDRWRLVE